MSQIEMIFDTNCVLCSGFVHFILAREANQNIVFINAWSESGLQRGQQFGVSKDEALSPRTVINGLAMNKTVLCHPQIWSHASSINNHARDVFSKNAWPILPL